MNTLPADLLKIISNYKDQIEHSKKFKKSLSVVESLNPESDCLNISTQKYYKTFYYKNEKEIIKQCYEIYDGTEVYSFNERGALYKITYSEHGLVLQNMEDLK